MFKARAFSVALGPVKALHELSFDIDDGESVAIVGANAAGKSTLCACLLGVIPHLRPGHLTGLLLVGGIPTVLQDARAIGKRVGLILEDAEAQFVSLSVGEEVALTLAAHGRDISEKSVRAALRLFGVEGLFERHPRTLSEGEKRRVALAALGAATPQSMVLDDPTGALDESGRDSFGELVRRGRELGLTIAFSTHDMAVASRCAGRLVGLTGGSIVVDLPVTGSTIQRCSNAVFSDKLCEIDAPPEVRIPLRTNQTLVEGRGVTFAYRRTKRQVLNKLDIFLKAGDVLVVRGPNGSGKTTLLHLLAGLLSPSAGTVRVCGTPPREIPMERRSQICGFVFQNPEHQILMDQVEDELLSAFGTTGRRPHEYVQWLEWLANSLRIPHLHTDPHSASRGQKKVLAVATALMPLPSLLLLDEPELGLDPLQRGRVRRVVELLRDRCGIGVIATAHDSSILENLSGAQTLDLQKTER